MRISSINYSVNFGSRRNYSQQNNVTETVKHEDSKGTYDLMDYFCQGYRRLGWLNAYGNRPIDAFNETLSESPCEIDICDDPDADVEDFKDDPY